MKKKIFEIFSKFPHNKFPNNHAFFRINQADNNFSQVKRAKNGKVGGY